MGFEAKDDDPDVRYYGRGSSGFLLQNFYVKDWADNFMMAMHVEVQDIVDSGEFSGARVKAPQLEDWGMRVMYIWDPTGVLWHVTAEPG